MKYEKCTSANRTVMMAPPSTVSTLHTNKKRRHTTMEDSLISFLGGKLKVNKMSYLPMLYLLAQCTHESFFVINLLDSVRWIFSNNSSLSYVENLCVCINCHEILIRNIYQKKFKIKILYNKLMCRKIAFKLDKLAFLNGKLSCSFHLVKYIK